MYSQKNHVTKLHMYHDTYCALDFLQKDVLYSAFYSRWKDLFVIGLPSGSVGWAATWWWVGWAATWWSGGCGFSPAGSATFLHGDLSWNMFYGHSLTLPSADSRRAVVSFWWKNVHNTAVLQLGFEGRGVWGRVLLCGHTRMRAPCVIWCA